MSNNHAHDTRTTDPLQRAVQAVALNVGANISTGGGGGGGYAPPPDAGLYDLSSMNYLGAFRINYSSGGNNTNAYNFSKIGFRPSDGVTNGNLGSIYLDSHVYVNAIAEFEIPTTLGQSADDVGSLPNAINLQPYTTIKDRAPNPDGNDNNRIGYIGMVNGKMHVSWYNNYDNHGNNHNLLIVDDPTDLAGSPIQGFFKVEGRDRVASYISPVPDEWQGALGGDILIGNGGAMSIVTRTSNGPSLYTFPSNFTMVDGELPANQWLDYPTPGYNMSQGLYPAPADAKYAPPGGNWDKVNEMTSRHFEAIVGMSYQDWQLAGETPDWRTLEPAPSEVVNDLWMTSDSSTMNQANFGMIIPGTRTFLTIGHMEARRFGGGYKIKQAGTSSNGGGYSAFFADDVDTWYWAFDMDEILAAENPWEVMPYDRGVFDNNRWLLKTPTNSTGIIKSGAYDPVNDRLYVAHRMRQGSTFNTVVAVYSLFS